MMIKANIWDFHNQQGSNIIIIPTNGFVKKNGEAVMGAGLAKQCKNKFIGFPTFLGKRLKKEGNKVHFFPEFNIITFPVKHNWYEKADIELIEKSCMELSRLIIDLGIGYKYYLPKVGCGNGRLSWKEVEPIIKNYLPFITIVDRK